MTDKPRQASDRLIVRHLEVDADHAEQRLDNFLFSRMKGVPKSRIYQMIRRGEVRVNKRRARPLNKLKSGDIVRVPQRDAPRATSAPELSDDAAANLRSRILFEDEHLLVVNKAVGEVVHAGSHHRHGLVDRLHRLYDTEQIRLLHRIDRGTTGCLLFAKSRPIMLAMHKAFRERVVNKTYLALVAGRWASADKMLVSEDARGKRLETRFRIRRAYTRQTLLEVRPYTGRTHQIRIQTAERGCPIVGDRKYGRREFDKVGGARDGRAKRLFLHAWKVSFELNGKTYRFEAPTDDAWDAFIARCAAASEKK